MKTILLILCSLVLALGVAPANPLILLSGNGPNGGGGASSSLLTDLAAYWKLDEASSNALDAHGTNELTDDNTVGATTGLISGARSFVRANGERFTIADNAELAVETGATAFTFAGWFQFNDDDWSVLMAKQNPSTGDREFSLVYENLVSIGGLRFRVNGAQRDLTFNASPATWYFIVAWHDPVAQTINIQIDNGTPAAAAHATGTTHYAGSGFCLGGIPGESFRHDGLMDEVGFWKRVLTSDERTELYNAGAGLSYPF